MTATLDRRDFLIAKLTAGFALAVQPIAAETINTDTEGLTAGEIEIATPDGKIPAYRAMPDKKRSHPTILVVQEIFGVHEHIKDICRRLAKAGYLAIAPELYARQGDVSGMKDFQQIISQVVSKVPDAQVMSDLDATTQWAAANSGNVNRLGITGFCWGGRIVWLYGAHSPTLKAGVAWYGRLESPSSELAPKSPIDVVKELKAPILGLYGGKDQGIPVAQVEKMRSALKSGSAAARRSMIQLYAEAPHGFHADYRGSYRELDAKDAWQRMLIWFKKNKV